MAGVLTALPRLSVRARTFLTVVLTVLALEFLQVGAYYEENETWGTPGNDAIMAYLVTIGLVLAGTAVISFISIFISLARDMQEDLGV